MPLFTLPNPRTSIHDQNNWLYDWDKPQNSPPSIPETPQIYDHHYSFLSDAETDPETPAFYHHYPSHDHADSNTFAAPISTPPPSIDQAIAITALQSELDCLREDFITLWIDFHSFMDVVTE